MKATIYTLLVLVPLAVIAYFIYASGHAEKFTPTGDFNSDDQKLYDLIRADLQAREMKLNSDSLAWLDDLVKANYDTSIVDGYKSKTAAYVNTLRQVNPSHPNLPRYTALLTNLTNRYKPNV